MTTKTISETISATFKAAFESHPARHTDEGVAMACAIETAAEAIPAGVTGAFDQETLAFTADEPKVHWTRLEMHNAADNRMPDAEERIAALTEWRSRGSILEWTFGRMGGAHERDDDASTWGPETASDVDWSGFDSTAAYRVIVGEKGNEMGHVISDYPFAPLSRPMLSEGEAREVLADQLKAYKSDGWGRVEVQYPDETGWRRLGE